MMPGRVGRSTLGAMASRNTKVANVAKRSIASFKTSVINLTKKVRPNMSENERQDLLKQVQKVQDQRNVILTALHNYSEELKLKNESFALYDSLLAEFKDFMDKLDDLKSKLVNNNDFVSTVEDPPTLPAPVSLPEEEQILEQKMPAHIRYELESNILDERSQQIQALRSTVYGIQDLYEEIGEMVEYQGEQLDSIENNMYNAYFNSRDANVILRDIDRGGSMPRSKYYVLILLIFCMLLAVLIYRKI